MDIDKEGQTVSRGIFLTRRRRMVVLGHTYRRAIAFLEAAQIGEGGAKGFRGSAQGPDIPVDGDGGGGGLHLLQDRQLIVGVSVSRAQSRGHGIGGGGVAGFTPIAIEVAEGNVEAVETRNNAGRSKGMGGRRIFFFL